jgi:hypothetical protein
MPTSSESGLTGLRMLSDRAAGAGAHLNEYGVLQLPASLIAIITTLPAQTQIFIVALAINKALLARWLSNAEGDCPTC